LKKIEVVTNYQQKKIETDFSGLGGIMKLMELMMGGKPTERSSKKTRIAVVYAVGLISEGKSRSDVFGGSSLGSTTLIAAIRKAADDPKVAAICVADRQPRRIVHGQRSDLARNGPHPKTGDCQHGRRGRQRRILYRHGRQEESTAAPCTLTGSIGVFGGKACHPQPE